LLKCSASVNGLGLFQLYFTTFFPFCQIGKVGKVANFAANLRLPLRPWGVDGKRSKRKVGGIFGKFWLRLGQFFLFPSLLPYGRNVKLGRFGQNRR
jgi:hypothetical protein